MCQRHIKLLLPSSSELGYLSKVYLNATLDNFQFEQINDRAICINFVRIALLEIQTVVHTTQLSSPSHYKGLCPQDFWLGPLRSTSHHRIGLHSLDTLLDESFNLEGFLLLGSRICEISPYNRYKNQLVCLPVEF